MNEVDKNKGLDLNVAECNCSGNDYFLEQFIKRKEERSIILIILPKKLCFFFG